MHASKTGRGINSVFHFPIISASQEVAGLLMGKAHTTVSWESKSITTNIRPFLFLSLNFYCWIYNIWIYCSCSIGSCVQQYSLVSLGQLFQLCPLPTFCTHPSYSLLWEVLERKKAWTCWKHCSTTVNTALATNESTPHYRLLWKKHELHPTQ